MKSVVIDASIRRLFAAGLSALLISAVAAICAGIYLGSISEIIAWLPAILILIPPSINMRGSISGVLASRLSSSIHLGGFDIDFSKKSVMGSNIRASLSVSVMTSFILGIIVWMLSAAFGFNGLNPLDFVTISVVSGIIASLCITGFTILIILAGYKYELDLDMIGSPSVTTFADLITIPILVCTVLFITGLPEILRIAVFIPVLLLFAASLYMGFRTDDEIRDVAKELLPLLIPLMFICTLAGIIYAEETEVLTYFAVFLILITPFSGGCGSIGGILCSRLATGIHMGEIKPEILPSKDTAGYFATSYVYAVILMFFLGILSNFCAESLGMNTPGLIPVLAVCIAAGLIVITMVNFIACATASISFRKGYDPDNFGIPVITGFIDLIGASTLAAVINMIV